MNDEIARVNDRGHITAAPHPAQLTLDLSGTSADGFAIRGRARLAVRVAPGEEAVLKTTLMAGSQVLRAADLAAEWNDRARKAAAGGAPLPAADWLANDPAIAARIGRDLAAAAYITGLELAGPVTTAFESPDHDAAHEAARRQAERARREAERVESVKRLGQALHDLRTSGLPASAALASAGPDGGQSLLLSALAQEGGARIWVAAGPTIAEVTRTGAIHALPLPADLGPTRSVAPGADALLIGARDGIWRLPRPDAVPPGHQPPPPVAYRDPDFPAEHGFSLILRHADHLFASHRQRGIVAWRLDEPHHPAVVVRPAAPGGPWPAMIPLPATSRLAADAPALVIAGAALELLTVAGVRTSLGILPAPCLFLAELDGRIAAACEDGVIRLFDAADLRPAGELRVGEPIVAAALLPWVGGSRLLCATPTAIVALSPDDPVTVRYVSPHKAVRELAAGKGMIAAVTSDRMRLLLWDAHAPAAPAAEIHLAGVTQSRIADVTIA